MAFGTSPIAQSFSRILSATALTDVDQRAFTTHRAGIEASLKNAFKISKIEPIGSYARGSAIKTKSDLDLFVVLRRPEVEWGDETVLPQTILNRVRTALKGTFSSTAIGRDGQAVVVEFSDGRSIDVVPAWWVEQLDNGWPLYAIPGTDDEWLETAPSLHNKYINDGDDRAGGQLKSVVRILKFWRRCRTPALPLSGFHLELLLTQEGICDGVRSHAACVADALELLAERGCEALEDPCGVSGDIPAAGTDAKVVLLDAAVQVAAPRAEEAVRLEEVGLYEKAWDRWRLVFNNRFPT